jgi:hypothetical protein
MESGEPGKWCVFPGESAVDDAWKLIRSAVEAGRLPAAKVSTKAAAGLNGNRYVICVYNRDWRDNDEIARARAVLAELGFTEELGYKRDIETIAGVYGLGEWYLRR